MKRLNWHIVTSNIQDVREELDRLQSKMVSTRKPSEIEVELALRHAYHHLNMAWNARHAEMKTYKNLTDTDFTEWGQFPAGLDDLKW